MFPVLSQNIPFRRADVTQHQWYAKQSFIVLQYAPDLHEEILRLLINKCLEIDVEIKIDHSGKVSLDENNTHENMFDLDLDTDIDMDTDTDQNENKNKNENENDLKVKRMKEKLHKEKVEVDEMAERVSLNKQPV